ncbi:hypothetical protein TanjilG_29248 [Lupinus angustifolius]|uniref:60S acidic ribosomal protein P1 n=1 Tax=Lupinus angustifolius TaxID=3871 RepID=A0A1J7IL70_LUPAN|nr:PREDICTED: 60S acidic ribosomal protein P1-like [Lupinus angustifolius]OIW13507.1 hypothetical protein TanjilG_29248 [Lupinus angustifolius]
MLPYIILLNPRFTLQLRRVPNSQRNHISLFFDLFLSSVKMSLGETASTYAALVLHDAQIPVTADNISALLKSANVKVESYWPTLFAKLAEKRNVGELIASAGGAGAPVAVAAAPVAAASGGAAAAAAPAPQEEEPKEESDDDLGFGLFD